MRQSCLDKGSKGSLPQTAKVLSTSLQHSLTHGLLLCAAVQTLLTAALCHCNYTYSACLVALCCCAKAADSSLVSLVTAVKVCTCQGKCMPFCSVLLCSQAVSSLVAVQKKPIKVCYPYRRAITKPQCSAALSRASCMPLLLCAAVQPSWQQSCSTATTPSKVAIQTGVSITKYQCSTAHFRAKCMMCCSVPLCKQADSSLVPLHLHSHTGV